MTHTHQYDCPTCIYHPWNHVQPVNGVYPVKGALCQHPAGEMYRMDDELIQVAPCNGWKEYTRITPIVKGR